MFSLTDPLTLNTPPPTGVITMPSGAPTKIADVAPLETVKSIGSIESPSHIS